MGHSVTTAFERGWSQLQNGDLITAAEISGFDLFVTTDRNLKYQQNLAVRRIALVVLLSTSWPRIQRVLPQVTQAVDAATPGSYVEIEVPGFV